MKVEIKDLVVERIIGRRFRDSLARVRPDPGRARLPRWRMRRHGTEGRRCGWIVYGSGTRGVAAAATTEPSGSYSHRVPGAGFAQKAASLSLPPFQPGTPCDV